MNMDTELILYMISNTTVIVLAIVTGYVKMRERIVSLEKEVTHMVDSDNRKSEALIRLSARMDGMSRSLARLEGITEVNKPS